MIITKTKIILLNDGKYHRGIDSKEDKDAKYGTSNFVTNEDILDDKTYIKIVFMKKAIEDRAKASTTPQPCDIIVLINPKTGVTYKNGHVEKHIELGAHNNICVKQPSTHVSRNLACISSGGPWLTAENIKEFKKSGTDTRLIWTWDNSGAGANNGVYFPVTVNVWEYETEDIY